MTGSDDELFFNITCRKEMPIDEFMQEIERAVVDLKDLFLKEKEEEVDHAKL